jgi:proline dehydrogenase
MEIELNLEDTQIAYHHLDQRQLKKAIHLFRAMNLPGLSTLAPKLLPLAIRWGLPVDRFLVGDLYRHFCGGENLAQAMAFADQLQTYGVQSVLDYGGEGLEEEGDLDQAKNEILSTLTLSDPKKIPFAVIKLTSIMESALLKKRSLGEPFTTTEQIRWDKAMGRWTEILEEAQDLGRAVLLDAEESWITPVTEDLGQLAMARYNKTRPTVYMTLQMYKKKSLSDLKNFHKKAIKGSYILGIKMVRGAYHSQEIAYAQKNRIPIPVFEKKSETDQAFHQGMTYCLEEGIPLFLGTHNTSSTLEAARFLAKKGNKKETYFSQLLGMSDGLSFNLARSGFLVCKYVPYGPLNKTIPYLMRRAQENRSIQGQTGRELAFLLAEWKRRYSK